MAGSPEFIILAILSTGVFAVGAAGNVLFWLQGNPQAGFKPGTEGAGFAPAPAALFAIGTVLKGLADGRVWRSFVVDTLLQRRLWRLSRLRWLMQIGFIWGAAELFLVGSMGNMLAERGVLPIAKDTPWFALLNEAGAVLVLTAVGIALYRRFVAREIALPTSPGDAALVVLLATTVLTGILTEAARLIAGPDPGMAGWFSFLGYSVALALRLVAPGWAGAYEPLWWLHIVASFSLVAYLPYGKLFHLFVSPVVLAAGATDR